MPTVPPILNHRFRLRNGTRTFLCEDVEQSRAAQGFACDLDDHVYCPNCDSPSGSVN